MESIGRHDGLKLTPPPAPSPAKLERGRTGIKTTWNRGVMSRSASPLSPLPTEWRGEMTARILSSGMIRDL